LGEILFNCKFSLNDQNTPVDPNDEEIVESESSPKNQFFMPEPKTVVESIENRIYFYSTVDEMSALKLNKELRLLSNSIIARSIIHESTPLNLFLHINSYGGALFESLSVMDEILKINKRVPITTIVDGKCASGSTLIAMAGKIRLMKKNSYMMIHQLRGGSVGTYNNMKDSNSNADKIHLKLIDLYCQFTKLTKRSLIKLLEHDLYMDSKEALSYGFIDAII
jgi:ATP-dependent Clp protease protease subunit